MAFPKCEFCGNYTELYGDARNFFEPCTCDKSHHFPWLPLLLIVFTLLLWVGCYMLYGWPRHWWLFVLMAMAINYTHDLEKVSWKTFLEAYRKWST